MKSMRGMVGVLTLLCLAEAGSAQRPKARGNWHTDYAAARALARKSGKPMMVVFRCQP
jgi:hypothetical protein